MRLSQAPSSAFEPRLERFERSDGGSTAIFGERCRKVSQKQRFAAMLEPDSDAFGLSFIHSPLIPPERSNTLTGVWTPGAFWRQEVTALLPMCP